MDGYVMITLIQSDRPTQLPRGPNVSYVFLEFELQVPVRTDQNREILTQTLIFG